MAEPWWFDERSYQTCISKTIPEQRKVGSFSPHSMRLDKVPDTKLEKRGDGGEGWGWGWGGGQDKENKRQKQQQQKKLNQNKALQSSLWKQKSLWCLKLCLPLVTTLTMSVLPHRLQPALFSWEGEASVDKQACSFPLKTQMGAPVWGCVSPVMNGTCSWFNCLGLRASSAAYHEAARALLKCCARSLTCTMRVREPQVAVRGEQELPSALALCLAEGALATAVLEPMKTLVLSVASPAKQGHQQRSH